MPYWMRKTLPYYAPDGGAGVAGADAAGGDAAAAAAAAGAAGAGAGGTGAAGAGAGAAAADNWRDPITDKAQREFADRILSPADAVRTAYELRQKLSTAVTPPGKDAKPEEIAEFREKVMGVPKTPDGYKITLPDAYKDDDGAKAGVADFVKAMHAEGVPPAGVQKAVETFYAIEAAKDAARTAVETKAVEAATTALKQKWGNDYDRNVTFGERAAADLTKAMGMTPDALLQIELRDGSRLGANPAFVEAMAIVGRRSGEAGLESSATTAEAATVDNRIRELMGLMTSDQARYKSKAVQSELQGLFARKAGSAPIVGGGGRSL